VRVSWPKDERADLAARSSLVENALHSIGKP
jgi:hypothetical protein